jgi:hypothetical protein
VCVRERRESGERARESGERASEREIEREREREGERERGGGTHAVALVKIVVIQATSVWGLKLLVYEALSTSVGGLKEEVPMP